MVHGISHYGEFDPLTVLGDLLDTAKGVSNEDNYKRLADNFCMLFKVTCEDEDYFEYFEKMCALRKIVLHDKDLTLATFERLRSFFDLKFDFDIVDRAKDDEIDTLLDTPIRFGFCNIETALNSGQGDNHLFMYRCRTMVDVPFAVLHYLLWNGYKFRQCEHCEQLFAAKSFKTKYCTRKSPFERYTHLPCWEAVDHIKKHFKKRKNSILKNLNTYYPLATYAFLIEYDECNLFEGKVSPRYWFTLKEIERITDKRYIKEKWYKAEYK